MVWRHIFIRWFDADTSGDHLHYDPSSVRQLSRWSRPRLATDGGWFTTVLGLIRWYWGGAGSGDNFRQICFSISWVRWWRTDGLVITITNRNCRSLQQHSLAPHHVSMSLQMSHDLWCHPVHVKGFKTLSVCGQHEWNKYPMSMQYQWLDFRLLFDRFNSTKNLISLSCGI